MSRDEESLHRSRENMRMTAVKTVPRTVVQKGPRTIEGDGKAKRKLARGMTHFYRGLDMLRFELFFLKAWVKRRSAAAASSRRARGSKAGPERTSYG